METYLRFLTSTVHVITALILSIILYGCGGSGGVGTMSIPTGSGDDSTLRALGDTRSADFGTHFLTPGVEDIGRYSWISPFPSPGNTRHFASLRPHVENLAMAYDGVLIGKTNPYYVPIEWERAVANGWIMRDDNGELVPYRNSTESDPRYVCDPAAPGYAEAWAEAVIGKAKELNCDYIWIDGINEKLRWIAEVDRIPAKYRPVNDHNWQAWQDALYTWLTVVVDRAHAAGLKVAANLNSSWTDGPMARKANLLDCVMYEFAFVGGVSSSVDTYSAWQSEAQIDRMISQVQAVKDKKVLLITRAIQGEPEFDKKIQFGVAAYLTARKEGDVLILWDRTPDNSHPRWTQWHPLMEMAQNLGQATSEAIKDGQLWIRHYRNGTVVLNPTGQTLPIPEAARVNPSAPTSIPARTGTLIPTGQ